MGDLFWPVVAIAALWSRGRASCAEVGCGCLIWIILIGGFFAVLSWLAA